MFLFICFQLNKNKLNTIIEDLEDIEIDDEVTERKVKFCADQLRLALKDPNGRRYSPALLATAMMWERTSPALYKQFIKEKLFTLPSIAHLRRLSSSLDCSDGLSESMVEYLKLRIKNLSDLDKTIIVLVDEVYNSQRVEFVSGKLFGVKDGEVTKTMLGVMIKSAATGYSDMVSITPQVKLNAKILKAEFDRVLEAVTDVGFDVVGVSADNHAINRRFFSHELGGGSFGTSVQHPLAPGKKIHLTFDSVHVFKNLYNNFVNKRIFQCPPFLGEVIGDPRFSHVEDLYVSERGQSIRMAYKLKDKVMNPKHIEKTCVNLADSFFHESTIAGLEYRANRDKPEWWPTVKFMKLVKKWWKTVNVKGQFKGLHKRDQDLRPITKDNSEPTQFLKQFADWLQVWDQYSGNSLTRETCNAARQTCLALSDLSEYLLHEKGFLYVLLGKIQSDVIESHFGRLRGGCGGIYYISVRQILECEKTIRVQSLVKFSGVTMKEIKGILAVGKQSKEEIWVLFELELERLDLQLNFQLTDEFKALFYVAGFIVFSLCKSLKQLKDCKDCVSLLVFSDVPPSLLLEEALPENWEQDKGQFVEQVDRGGLVSPSDLIYVSCMIIHLIYEQMFLVKEEKEAKIKLLECKCPRDAFAVVCVEVLKCTESTEPLSSVRCEQGHDYLPVFEEVAKKMFNCFAKNYVTYQNDIVRTSKKRPSSEGASGVSGRQIMKLQSGQK